MRNAECGMRNEKERLMQLLDAEYMWSEKDCEAVADYLIANGVGFVDDLHEEVKLLEKDKPRYFVRGEITTDDIEMLTNLNDRS